MLIGCMMGRKRSKKKGLLLLSCIIQLRKRWKRAKGRQKLDIKKIKKGRNEYFCASFVWVPPFLTFLSNIISVNIWKRWIYRKKCVSLNIGSEFLEKYWAFFVEMKKMRIGRDTGNPFKVWFSEIERNYCLELLLLEFYNFPSLKGHFRFKILKENFLFFLKHSKICKNFFDPIRHRSLLDLLKTFISTQLNPQKFTSNSNYFSLPSSTKKEEAHNEA